MIVVRLRFAPAPDDKHPWESEVHFDPAVNYLIRKVVRSKGRFVHTEEVVQFKDCGAGVFFPERVRGQSGVGDEISVRSEAVLSDVRVNQPLPADIFRLRYPQGITLADSIRGTMYRVDADGNPLSPEKALASDPPPAPSRLAGPDDGAETKEEPWPRYYWLMAVSAAVVATASPWPSAGAERRATRKPKVRHAPPNLTRASGRRSARRLLATSARRGRAVGTGR